MPVKVSTPTIKKYIKNMQPTEMIKMLTAGAVFLQGVLQKLWIKGIGGNETTLQSPTINEQYKKIKTNKTEGKKIGTGRGYIDMHLTGKMAQGMRVTKVDDNTVALGFESSQMGKAAGNYNKRPQFFKVSDRIKKQIQERALKHITKKK
jgi:hypothetical protein